MMKRLALALFLAAGLPASPALAQATAPLAIQPGSTLLTVSAEGRSVREPDLAMFSAGVSTQGKTAGGALDENSRAMSRVIAALKAAGIAERDIQTSNLSINPVYNDPNREAMLEAQAAGRPYVPDQRPPKIIGYSVSNQVSVRQRKLGNYGRVIDALVDAGANQVNGPSFAMDDSEAALDAARSEAMKRARARAELYARAAGLRVTRVVSISEGGGYVPPQPLVYARMAMADAAAPAPPVQAGELQLTANVTVLYELAP